MGKRLGISALFANGMPLSGWASWGNTHTPLICMTHTSHWPPTCMAYFYPRRGQGSLEHSRTPAIRFGSVCVSRQKKAETTLDRGPASNKLKTTPTPNKNGSWHTSDKSGFFVCHKSRSLYAIKVGWCTTFSVKVPLCQGILHHTTPHFVAYFGSIFLANIGGGGGQNCFHATVGVDKPARGPHVNRPPFWDDEAGPLFIEFRNKQSVETKGRG